MSGRKNPIVGKRGSRYVPGMAFIADMHVHLYPCHDIAAALRGAMSRLDALAPGLPRVLCLTERSDCHFFRDIISGTKKLPPPFSAAPSGEGAIEVIDNAGGRFFIVAGRQAATMEKLEIHCIGCDAEIPERLPLPDAIERVIVEGGIPAIPWGLGKWLGARGRLVEEILGKHVEVFASDSSMRPVGWPEKIFRAAPSRVIFGSDPLPVRGEEIHVGRYATLFGPSLDEGDPAASVAAALRTGNFRSAGSRCGPVEVWLRQQAMKKAVR